MATRTKKIATTLLKEYPKEIPSVEEILSLMHQAGYRLRLAHTRFQAQRKSASAQAAAAELFNRLPHIFGSSQYRPCNGQPSTQVCGDAFRRLLFWIQDNGGLKNFGQ